MRVPRHQVEGPAGDQHPRESPTGGGEGAHRRRAGGSPATPPEAAGLSHQETWHLRQQSHQGVELIACHALIACLHLTRVQEPVRNEANSAGSCFHRPVPPPPNAQPAPCSSAQQQHPLPHEDTWLSAHSPILSTSPGAPTRHGAGASHPAPALGHRCHTAPNGTDSPQVPETSNPACPKHRSDNTRKLDDS